MIVLPWRLEPNDRPEEEDGSAHSRWDVPDEEEAPPDTVAVVITVESRVRVTFDGSDPAARGLLLRQGEHVLPIAGGRMLRAANAGDNPAMISILWLRYRPDEPEGGGLAKEKR
jgi:hypothetical protein